MEWLKDYKRLKDQQPCEDAISRQAALGCCRNEWEEEVEIRLKSLPPVTPQLKYEDIAKAFQLGVAFGFGEKYDEMDKVMEEVKKIITPDQQPCEDAISRQAVLDEAFEVDTKEYGRIDVVGVDAIVALPPVTSQLKTGHWIVYDHGCGVKYYQCSICKGFDGDVKGKYCKWCGAKMVELHESEDKKC